MLPVGDLRYGVRLLWRAPAFTLIALLALALGMGATTAIFSVVDAVLLKPLPFREPKRLLVLWERNAAQHKFRLFVAGANFLAWQKQSRGFEGLAAIRDLRINLTAGPNGHIEPEELRAERVSANLFPVLGVQATTGRTFRAEEDRPGHTNYALLSHALWQRRFGADPAIAGKAIRLGDQSYSVLGVLPAGFTVLEPAVDVWLPLGLDPAGPAAYSRNLVIVGRMNPGIGIEQARAEMETIGSRLEAADPKLNTGWRPSLFPLRDEIVGTVREPLLVLFAAVGCLLLMACVNVANLLLARGTTRRREIAVRSALGASRGRVVSQLLAESIVLALAGGLIGLVLARGGMALVARFGPSSIPRLGEARLDARLFLFALASSVLTGVLFGVAPALQVSSANLNAVLTEYGRGGTSSRMGRLMRNTLVVVEVGLAVVVLIASGLLIRSFVRLRAANPGFQASNLLTLRLSLAQTRYGTADRRVAFFEQISDQLAALPGVRAVGAVNSLPLTGLGMGGAFFVEGRPVAAEQRPIGLFRAVSASYFRAMGIPLRAGREFTVGDTARTPLVLIVSETLARRFWPEEGSPARAVGNRLVLPNGRTAEIVGVVGDVKPDRIEAEDWPTVYSVYPQLPDWTMTVVVRTSGEPLALASAVEREVHRIDPDQPVADIRPMEAVIDKAVAGARFNTLLLGIFAVVAFVMAAVGIYGVIGYDVSQRTHEIGIRMALGAEAADVLKLVLVQGARLAAAGIAAGLAAAYGLTRLMTTMLYGVDATDAYTFSFIAVLLGAVALFASYLPSRKATVLEPVAALRHE